MRGSSSTLAPTSTASGRKETLDLPPGSRHPDPSVTSAQVEGTKQFDSPHATSGKHEVSVSKVRQLRKFSLGRWSARDADTAAQRYPVKLDDRCYAIWPSRVGATEGSAGPARGRPALCTARRHRWPLPSRLDESPKGAFVLPRTYEKSPRLTRSLYTVASGCLQYITK